jgi:F420-dependent oxidoreductase-like protein
VRFGVHLGYWGSGPTDVMPIVREAEAVGFDAIWSAEAYGSDAVATLAWVASQTERIGVGTAIMQIPARSPAATAMTAITLDHLTHGRFRLGLGSTGPQVSEGWHGVSFADPLGRTREYVEIIRMILRREGPVEYHGTHYDLPLTAGTGMGKALKSIVHPLRADLPIYLAAIGPKNVALAGEIADGWIPTFVGPSHFELFEAPLQEGLSKAGRDRSSLDVAPMVPIAVADDLQLCRDLVKPYLALYVGGMGHPKRNFYNRLAASYGFEAEAKRVQELYLSGRKGEAAGAVPDPLVDEVALVGSKDRIADRLQVWREAGVDTIILAGWQPEAVRVVADAAEHAGVA